MTLEAHMAIVLYLAFAFIVLGASSPVDGSTSQLRCATWRKATLLAIFWPLPAAAIIIVVLLLGPPAAIVAFWNHLREG